MGLPLHANCGECWINIEDTFFFFWKVLLSDNGFWEKWLNVSQNGIWIAPGGTKQLNFLHRRLFCTFFLYRCMYAILVKESQKRGVPCRETSVTVTLTLRNAFGFSNTAVFSAAELGMSGGRWGSYTGAPETSFSSVDGPFCSKLNG